MPRFIFACVLPTLLLVLGCKPAGTPTPPPTPAAASVPASAPTSAPASAPAPTITIFGLSDSPASVVFLVNHSATPTNFADPVHLEIARAIKDLKAPTTVAFYVFSEDLRALAGQTLTPVTPEFRSTLAQEYARTDSSGSIENEVAAFQNAFQQALALQPEAIFLVTYSKPDPKLAPAVKELNKDAHVRINVLALIADPSPDVEAALAQIAKDSGGAGKTLREKDVLQN